MAYNTHIHAKTNNMQPFNLDRFRAGEPAYHKDTHQEYFYLSDLTHDRITVKYFNHIDGWGCKWGSIERAQDWFYMKEKELTWGEVIKMWPADDFSTLMIVNVKWLEENFEAPKPKNK